MPPFPGEETLATVYADVHSYFTAPSPRPALHRFDKATYFYIYYNSTRQSSRVEAAINAGTADQTAFNGSLENVKITNAHLFPTRMTVTVDGVAAQSTSPASARSARDPDEWRLASSDPRDPGTSKYRIHTLDLYFWSQDDAKLVVNIVKRLLHPDQLDLDEEHDEPQHQNMVSPVVQNLENVAISDPAYKNRQQENVSKAQYQHPAQLPSPSPPITQAQTSQRMAPSVSPLSANASVGGRSPVKTQAPPANFTPLAYNPAAPAAPEPIAHREDTPPPVDAASGTGLSAAAKHDDYQATQSHFAPFGVSSLAPHGAQGHYGSPPPPPSSALGPYAATPSAPSFGPQAAATVPPSFGPHATPSPFQPSPAPSTSTSFAPPPSAAPSSENDRHRHSTAAETYVPHGQDQNAHIFGQTTPLPTPGTQFYQSIQPGHTHKPLQHIQPQYPDYLSAGQAPAPVGGYSSYNYNQAQHPQAQQPGGYDIHNQVYRPTEAEHRHSSHSQKPSKSDSTRKPSHTERVEKGVGKWINKIEKKFG